MEQRRKHLVPDLLAPGLDLVFCGTAPSPASFKARAYYANPGNAFWATLHAVGLTPERLTPQRYPELLSWRIGLTDLNKTEYGSDHELSAHAMDAKSLHAKIAKYRPAAVAFTSKNAASLGRSAIWISIAWTARGSPAPCSRTCPRITWTTTGPWRPTSRRRRVCSRPT